MKAARRVLRGPRRSDAPGLPDHLMRRKHGGRRARVRGRVKVAADFALLAAAVNLARLAVLGVASAPGPGWASATA